MKTGSGQGTCPKIEPLRSGVYIERVRRGKANCRCAAGRQHLAHYRIWRERGERLKVYIRKADLADVRAGCAEWQRIRAARVMMLAVIVGQDKHELARIYRAQSF